MILQGNYGYFSFWGSPCGFCMSHFIIPLNVFLSFHFSFNLDHFVFCLKCKQQCQTKLSNLDGNIIEDVFPLMYNYLQFSYYKCKSHWQFLTYDDVKIYHDLTIFRHGFCYSLNYRNDLIQSNSVITNSSGPAIFVRYNRVHLRTKMTNFI